MFPTNLTKKRLTNVTFQYTFRAKVFFKSGYEAKIQDPTGSGPASLDHSYIISIIFIFTVQQDESGQNKTHSKCRHLEERRGGRKNPPIPNPVRAL